MIRSSGLGFYSRHLTDYDILKIQQETRAMLFGSIQQNAETVDIFDDDNLLLDQTAGRGSKVNSFWDYHIETYFWNSDYVKNIIIRHGATVLSMKVTRRYIFVGERKTGLVWGYNRPAIYSKEKTAKKRNVDKPILKFNTEYTERSILSLDSDDSVVVAGTNRGGLAIFDIKTGKLLLQILVGKYPVFSLKLIDKKIYLTNEQKIDVIQIKLTGEEASYKVLYSLEGHTREVLCLDVNEGVIASGGVDRILRIHNETEGEPRLLHALDGHKMKIRCLKIANRYCASGSWDRTVRLWNIQTGECVRVLRHEMQIRCIDMDNNRILTGDTYGYVFAWSVANCLDPDAGPDKYCLRAHNAMDHDLRSRDRDRTVYSLHLEHAVQAQVTGNNGRIGISDFWDSHGYDEFQVESYVHDVTI